MAMEGEYQALIAERPTDAVVVVGSRREVGKDRERRGQSAFVSAGVNHLLRGAVAVADPQLQAARQAGAMSANRVAHRELRRPAAGQQQSPAQLLPVHDSRACSLHSLSTHFTDSVLHCV